MLHNPLLLLLAHSALVQFSHEDGVAPLQHLSAVRRLPEFLSQAVRHAKQLLQLLARLLFMRFCRADRHKRHHHRKHQRPQQHSVYII